MSLSKFSYPLHSIGSTQEDRTSSQRDWNIVDWVVEASTQAKYVMVKHITDTTIGIKIGSVSFLLPVPVRAALTISRGMSKIISTLLDSLKIITLLLINNEIYHVYVIIFYEFTDTYWNHMDTCQCLFVSLKHDTWQWPKVPLVLKGYKYF